MVGHKLRIPEQIALLQLYYQFNADHEFIFEAFAEEFPGMPLPKRAAVWDAKWRFEATGIDVDKPRSRHPSIIEEIFHTVAQTSVSHREGDTLNTFCDTYDYNNIDKFVFGHFSFFYVQGKSVRWLLATHCRLFALFLTEKVKDLKNCDHLHKKIAIKMSKFWCKVK